MAPVRFSCLVIIVPPVLDKIKAASNFFSFFQVLSICVFQQKMPDLKMPANYTVIHLLFKVKEPNFCISIFVLFHSGSRKRAKGLFLFFFLSCSFLFFLMPSYIPRKFNTTAFLLPHELKGLFLN